MPDGSKSDLTFDEICTDQSAKYILDDSEQMLGNQPVQLAKVPEANTANSVNMSLMGGSV